MPKEQVVIERFRGVVQSADSRDVDLQVASHMDDIDPISKRGELRGRLDDDELNGVAVDSDVIALFRDGNEGVIWDGTTLKHMTTISTNPTASGTSSTPTSSGTASMASDGEAIRVGLGNGSTHTPQWIGEIEHAQFNGAVGPPAGTTHIKDAPVLYVTNSTAGTVTETNATSAAEAVWPLNSWVRWNISYEYDNYQHSPMGSIKTDRIGSANGAQQLDFTITTDPASFPERITAILLWRATASGEASAHPLDGPFVLAERIGMDNSGWTLVAGKYDYAVTDQGASGPTWQDYTGMPENQTFTTDLPSARLPADDHDIHYQYNTIANGFHIVGKVYHPNLNQTDNWLFRSLRNRHDMFNWAEDFLVLPTEPTHLETFLGRVYAFSPGIVYRINPETMEVEDSIPGIGLSGPESIIVSERGMFFCDTSNLYLHDGTQIHTIGHPVLDNDYDATLSWSGASHGINPICTYDGSKDLFIVLFESASTVYHGFAYHHPTNEWYIYSFDSTLGGGGIPTKGFVTHDGKPILIFDGTYVHVGGLTTRKAWKWVSKEVNNGIESIIPYHAFVEGDASTLLIREEHDAAYTIDLDSNPNYDGYMHRVRINSQVRNVAAATSWGRHNKVRMELNGTATDTVNALGMKIRRVRLREGADAGDGEGGITPITPGTPPDTIWWVQDASQDEVFKATIDNDNTPWTPVSVGSLLTGWAVGDLQVAPDDSYIFIEENNGTTSEINRYDLSLGSKTNITTGASSTNFIYSMCIHRGNQLVYWLEQNTASSGYILRRCAFDGTGTTTLYTASNVSQGKYLCIDQSANFLYWYHIDNVPFTIELWKFDLATNTPSTIDSSFDLNNSGSTEECVVDEDAGTAGKIWFAGRIPSTNEGIYVTDLSTPTVQTLLSPTTAANEQAVGRDRINDWVYYAQDSVNDNIHRCKGDGTSGELVVTATSTGATLSIDLGRD